MDMEKLTTKSREAMIASQNIAAEYGHQEIRPIHLLKALVDQEHAFGQRTGRSAELYVARFQPDSDPGKRDRRTHEG